MLAYYQKRSRGEKFEKIQKPIQTGMWLDGSNLDDLEIDAIVQRHSLAANVVYDVRDSHELSRVEFRGDEEAYIFLRVPWLAKSGHVAAAPLLCIVRTDEFFTLSKRDTYSPNDIAKVTHLQSLEQTTDLLLAVIAATVNAYGELLSHTERSINDTGSRLRSHEVTNQDFIHFVTVEDNLTAYRMNLAGILAVIDRLKETTHTVIQNDDREQLDDISLQVQQLLRSVESYSGRVESIRNAYSTIANNTLNQRMKTLTVFTVLLTIPNVFYGMFGMNVLLPFDQDDPWAYGYIVGFTAVFAVLLYLLAKWRRLF